MSDTNLYLISLFVCLLVVAVLNLFTSLKNGKRAIIIERMRGMKLSRLEDSEDVLERPFFDRTFGDLSRWLVKTVSRLTPEKFRNDLQIKLEKAGNPRGLKPGDVIALQGILGLTVLGTSWFLFDLLQFSSSDSAMLIPALTGITIYLPWFILARMATSRQAAIRKSLPDIMDLLVISVEAGLAFEMALLKVVERFEGPVADEFQRAIGEMQLGKSRKEALKAMALRVNIPEMSSLINSIVQSEQLGVGLSQVLRLQSDMIREKRQQQIEEQAMKAPVKIIFPLVFFIFPCMLIILLGPAMLNILKTF